jgi:nucleoside-diphosphate-sugar epimerase
MNKVLIVGASGSTGKLLVHELLQNGIEVTAIVRNSNSFSKDFHDQSELHIVEASISEMSVQDLASHLENSDAVLSCLGHNPTLKGIYGKPRRLVADAVAKISETILFIEPTKKVKFILMNTTGNSNPDIPEKPPFSQRCVISILRLILPPHVDNEKAADYLRIHIGQKHKYIEWVVVRPDSLTKETRVTEYDIHPSPIKNAIFDSAPSSRINVANFMSKLVINTELWNQWKGQMPVLYNHA